MAESRLDPTGAAEYFVAGARDAGLGHICISPGSRSTPLAVAALRTEGITTSVHLDERTGGFAALGRAISSGVPVGLICTSGTAGANYLPAVSEANMSHVPLVVMTSDRPPEHQSWGVGQTFEQVGLYHQQVRAEFTMPVGGDAGPDHALRQGWRAASTAIERSGPVHVNWPFRLPLEPVADPLLLQTTFEPAHRCSTSLDAREIDQLGRLLSEASAPLIIAGPDAIAHRGDVDERRDRATRFSNACEALGIPVLADVLSGLRGVSARSVILAPSLVLTAAETHGLDGADLIIHVGQTPTAKATRLWWERQEAVHVLLDPAQTWNDPSHRSTMRLTSDPIALLESARDITGLNAAPAHLQRWIDAGTHTDSVCRDAIASATAPCEPQIAAALSEVAGAGDIIVASSSMPIRDLDMFARPAITASVFSNRGVNGIDGVVATAGGVAADQQQRGEGRTFVLIGDVALLHDIGSVFDAARNNTPLTIVVPNNDGGGIFSFLPAKDKLDAETFSTLFDTPHGTSFGFLGGHPGISHTHVNDVADALSCCENDPAAVNIVELSVNTSARITFQHDLLSELSAPTA